MDDQRRLFDIIKALKDLNGEVSTFADLNRKLGFKLSETRVWRTCELIGYDVARKEIWYKGAEKSAASGGVDVRELKEACPDIYTMVDELEKAGEVFLLRNKDNTPRLAYFNCLNEHTGDGPAKFPASEFEKYWHDVQMPTDEDALLLELKKAGLTTVEGSSLNKPKKNVVKAKARRGRRMKVTNTHLEGVDLTKGYTGN
ncbi:hypothetical protein HDU96_005213 [Phlyctochytrium bullatum]|nr:hypothetical protein HDU96_005213 [Phlyctochytrium bullatum]